MNRLEFAIICVAVVLIVFAAMWWGWRRRTQRDSGIVASNAPLSGAVLASFSRVSYVSTTPVGAPLERVALPGLRYKGWADLAVRSDGIDITVTGEDTISLHTAQLRGMQRAGRRIGKAVEAEGLTVLRWLPAAGESRELESSFRFNDPTEQRRFADACTALGPQTSNPDQEEL